MTIPETATRVHIKMAFEMPADGVTFVPAETTVAIDPADDTAQPATD